jgi:hypothetical protein
MQSVRRQFRTPVELVTFQIGKFDIGYAVLSSLVSITREPEPDLQRHARLVHRLMRAAWITYQATSNLLSRERLDRVYVFNGRFASMRAVLRACQQWGVDCYLHERGCDMNHYDLYENVLPHDPRYIESRIRALWNADNAPAPIEKARIGGTWFTDRRDRIERNWRSFVKQQQQNLLPECFDRRRFNVGLFTSSDDEFVAIGDAWRQPIYRNQLDGVQRIAGHFNCLSDDYRLYVRLHPNQMGCKGGQLQALMNQRSERVVVIGPDEPIDSYALMEAVDNVATFGSSIGIEAAFWKKPSILLGPCFYRTLGGTYRPRDHADAVQMMTSRLTPGEVTGAVMYGYWFQTHGIPFKYFKATDLFEGRFMGQVVHARTKQRLRNRIGFKLNTFATTIQRFARSCRNRFRRAG